MQVGVIGGATPYGLPLNETTMAQHLQTLGYRRHIVGKVDLTLSATNVSHALLRLISVTVFNFTHPPALSALLQVISASRFLTPDFLLLVPVPFLFSVHLSPSYLTETLSGLLYIKPEVISFPKTLDLTVFHFVLMSSSVSS